SHQRPWRHRIRRPGTGTDPVFSAGVAVASPPGACLGRAPGGHARPLAARQVRRRLRRGRRSCRGRFALAVGGRDETLRLGTLAAVLPDNLPGLRGGRTGPGRSRLFPMSGGAGDGYPLALLPAGNVRGAAGRLSVSALVQLEALSGRSATLARLG